MLVATNNERILSWRLEGLASEILGARDRRIVSIMSYYAPTAANRTHVA
jgi:hypothetical protein